jgi:hypothetical protein
LRFDVWIGSEDVVNGAKYFVHALYVTHTRIEFCVHEENVKKGIIMTSLCTFSIFVEEVKMRKSSSNVLTNLIDDLKIFEV